MLRNCNEFSVRSTPGSRWGSGSAVRETIEVRLPEQDALRLIDADIGETIGDGHVRRIRLDIADPMLKVLSALDRRYRAEKRTANLPSVVRAALARSADDTTGGLPARGLPLFTYWHIRRRYAASELAAGDLIQLLPTRMFEPAGEERGTVYDYSRACPICGAGRRLVSDLRLDPSKVPKNADLAFTIARDEIVVSGRLGNLIRGKSLTGAVLLPVVDARLKSAGIDANWYHLDFDSGPVVASDPTLYGRDPFEPERSPHFSPGHVVGHAALSELYIGRESWDGSDFVRTRDPVGVRRGLLAPYPLLLVSRRAWQLLRSSGMKGFTPEVAHLVDGGQTQSEGRDSRDGAGGPILQW